MHRCCLCIVKLCSSRNDNAEGKLASLLQHSHVARQKQGDGDNKKSDEGQDV